MPILQIGNLQIQSVRLFKEDEIGSIEKGKQADIIILDQNLFEIPVHEIHNTKVTHTLFSGKVVYKKE